MHSTGQNTRWVWLGGGYNGTHHVWYQSGVLVNQDMIEYGLNLGTTPKDRLQIRFNIERGSHGSEYGGLGSYNWELQDVALCEEKTGHSVALDTSGEGSGTVSEDYVE